MKHNGETQLQVGKDIPKTELRAIEETYRREEDGEEEERGAVGQEARFEEEKIRRRNDKGDFYLIWIALSEEEFVAVVCFALCTLLHKI